MIFSHEFKSQAGMEKRSLPPRHSPAATFKTREEKLRQCHARAQLKGALATFY
jgi:hypothetical protein